MTPLEIIGIICLFYIGLKILYKVLIVLYCNFIKPSLRTNVFEKQKGRWAVVTGATDGIGKAYADVLADMGMNIALISRNIHKLNHCAGEIEARANVQTRVIAVDFTDDVSIYETIERGLSGIEIGILVNNVGLSYDYPEFFLDIPNNEKVFSSLIKANVVSVTKMCEIVLPGMVARKSGIIINISSVSAIVPAPMLTVYAATKRYVEKFSDELRAEYRGKGLTIQTLLPGYVATKMSKLRKHSLFAPRPIKYVKSALDKVGVFDHTTGYFPHTVMVNVINTLHSICPSLTYFIIMTSLKKIRSKAMARMAKMSVEES